MSKLSYDSYITKDKSNIIKFIAISFMIIHHLFAYPERIISNEYISIFYLNDMPIELYIGQLGKICVSMFLFISGYGMYISYSTKKDRKSIFTKIINFYIRVWIIGFIGFSIGFILNYREFNLFDYFLNMIGVSSAYNGEWWFIKVYIILIAMYPWLNYMICKYNNYIILTFSTIVFIIGNVLFKIDNIFFRSIAEIFSYQIYFLIGSIICKNKILNKFSSCIKRKKININITNFIILFLGIFLFFIIRSIKFIKVFAYIITFLFIIFPIAQIIKPVKIIMRIGILSGNIWLIHTFICYYYFQNFIFSFKYSILIFLNTFILSYLIAELVEFIYRGIKVLKSKLSGGRYYE